jgi:hypothetical protein
LSGKRTVSTRWQTQSETEQPNSAHFVTLYWSSVLVCPRARKSRVQGNLEPVRLAACLMFLLGLRCRFQRFLTHACSRQLCRLLQWLRAASHAADIFAALESNTTLVELDLTDSRTSATAGEPRVWRGEWQTANSTAMADVSSTWQVVVESGY